MSYLDIASRSGFDKYIEYMYVCTVERKDVLGGGHKYFQRTEEILRLEGDVQYNKS